MAFEPAPMKLPVQYNELNWEQRRLVRSRYVRIQKGLCSHCGVSLDHDPDPEMLQHRINWSLFPSNFRDHPVHLHHSHHTGLTIGAVHALCNAVLWQFHGE